MAEASAVKNRVSNRRTRPGGVIARAMGSGRAEPWPTRQQAMEARNNAAAGRVATASPSAPSLPVADGDDAGRAHPRSKKKKRRR